MALRGVLTVQAAWRHLAATSRVAHGRRTVVHSIPVSGPGGAAPADQQAQAQTAELISSMQEKISAALETERVSVTDAYGDAQHVSIDVVSGLFEGKNAVARQRMVYKAIWFELQNSVHAVDAMTVLTPEEADK